MKMVEEGINPPDLETLERSLRERIALVQPSPFFRSLLKDRLKSSKIYARRRELGATWVVSLGLSLVLTLVGMLICMVSKQRRLSSG